MERTIGQVGVETPYYDMSRLDALITRVFIVEEISLGNPKKDYIVRYRGHLRGSDSSAAYDQLSSQLAPLEITPLFRIENGGQTILLMQGRVHPKTSRAWINLVLGVLTFLSMIVSGGLYGMSQALPTNPVEAARQIVMAGLPFAISLLAILAAHEFGHYLMGRHHGVHVTLPYFIPMPFTPFGTMGAFINMKEPPKNRRQLLDIGLAGPFAGLIVAVPVLIIGLMLSSLDPLPQHLPPGQMISLEGNSLLYLGLKYLVFGQLLPAPLHYGSMPHWLYWIQYFFTGRPFPAGGMDVILHPVAWAGWAGILVTALNLIPAGQLDGGHAMYVLVGRKTARRLLPFILVGIAVLGMFWVGWWLWVLLIFFLGRSYAEPLDQITPLDSRRRWLAVLAIIVFLLVFTPVPLNLIS